MSFQDTKYLYFYVKNHTNTFTTTGYTLPITPFTFIPVLDTGSNDLISTTRMLWNFGDGTTSRDITATHAYSMPGTYNVTCHFYTTGGEGYESSFTQSIIVVDYIPNSIVVSAAEVNVIEAGHYQNPFTVNRFNSWQTYPTLSTQGATIMFHASGSGAPLIDVETYENDKYAHLKAYAKFLVYEYNSITQQQELVPVEHTKTQNNTDIYVKLDAHGDIIHCNASDVGSTLAGTSGSRVVYFTDDLVQIPISGAAVPKDVIATVFMDTQYLVDHDSYNKSYVSSEYPILRQLIESSYVPRFIDQTHITHLTITSNGIDGEGVVLTGFNIGTNKFVNQKIPFVVKVKDIQNFTTKSVPRLTYTSGSLSSNNVRVQLRDANSNNNITDGVSFYTDFGEFSASAAGGFFKGYMVCSKPYENVYLHAEAMLSGSEYFTIPTYYLVISHPESSHIHRIEITPEPEYNLTDKLIYTPTLTGVYTAIAVPSRDSNTGNINTVLWVADADKDVVYKLDKNGAILLSAAFAENASPSNLVTNSNGDLWVSLYDGVSTVKISNSTGEVLSRAVLPFANQDWSSESLYNVLSGFAGQNSILPTSIDTDIYDNLWVTYSNPLSGYVVKYNSIGQVIKTTNVPTSYQATDVITTTDNRAWVVYKQTNVAPVLSGKDSLACFDLSGNLLSTFELSCALWNLTVDVKDNLWATANRSDVICFDTNTHTFSTYNLISTNTIDDTCDFAGIGCTTESYMVVVDDARKQLLYFDINNITSTAITGVSSLLLEIPSDISDGVVNANMLNAYGDWTGFRHINKYFHKRAITDGLIGDSNIFNVYPHTGKYKIGKKNENVNPAAQYRAHVFQESFSDHTRLIEEFFGAAIGDENSTHEAVGKRLYERIANFTDNVINVDTCNIDMLESLHVMLNDYLVKLHAYNFNYPSNLGRIMDLLSIKFTKLRGDRNKYNSNFNARGHLNLTDSMPFSGGVRYGRNRGEEIDFFTTILTGGVDGYLVAFEKFSEQYHLVNTNLSYASYIDYINPVLQTYALSSYDLSGRWGWGLVLPSNVTTYDIDKYYTFFKYNSAADGNQIAGVINWSDPQTTLVESITSIQQWYDVMENMITYTLVDGLELLSSSST